MSDKILDKTEFNDEDDGIAYKKGDLTHRKVIPILLRPDVIYPFHAIHMEVEDEEWKRIFDEYHEKKQVVGIMYCNNLTEDLPPVGRVATSGAVDEIHKAVNGKHIVKIVPVNRFFTKEHIETEPILWAEVAYYWDHAEDDSVIEPLLKEFLPLLHRMGKITRGKRLQELTLEQLREDILLYSFSLFYNHPELTDEEQLVALWMYKLSQRIAWLIELLEDAMNDRIEKLADLRFEAKNN